MAKDAETSELSRLFAPPGDSKYGYCGSDACFWAASPQGVLFPFVGLHVRCLQWSCTCFCIRWQALPRLVHRRWKALRLSRRRQLCVVLSVGVHHRIRRLALCDVLCFVFLRGFLRLFLLLLLLRQQRDLLRHRFSRCLPWC